MYCTQCGFKLPENSKFCSQCGSLIKRVEDESQQNFDAKASTPVAACARCGSTSIATINCMSSGLIGLISNGVPVNVCQVCGYRWRIG